MYLFDRDFLCMRGQLLVNVDILLPMRLDANYSLKYGLVLIFGGNFLNECRLKGGTFPKNRVICIINKKNRYGNRFTTKPQKVYIFFVFLNFAFIWEGVTIVHKRTSWGFLIIFKKKQIFVIHSYETNYW